jgi:hypothetical protein
LLRRLHHCGESLKTTGNVSHMSPNEAARRPGWYDAKLWSWWDVYEQDRLFNLLLPQLIQTTVRLTRDAVTVRALIPSRVGDPGVTRVWKNRVLLLV